MNSEPEVNPRTHNIFPVLSDLHVEFVKQFGKERILKKGDALFHRGERIVDFFVVLEGSIEVYDQPPCGGERVFVRHGVHQFTGELDQFNEQKILVNARAETDVKLIAVKRADFRRMLVAEPDLAEIILRALVLRRMGLIRDDRGGISLIGDENYASTLRIRQFLTRNGFPHHLIAPDHKLEDGRDIMTSLELVRDDLPAIWQQGENVLKNPSIKELAMQLGLHQEIPPGHIYDVIVVGAGPAGLAAAVYAASEGLDTLNLEGLAPGGQAGTSSRIENYLGFPNGLSGQELAGRAKVQAQKFGAHLSVGREVSRLDRDDTGKLRITLEDGEKILGRTVVVASGARYRKLNLANYAHFEGRGIHYAATAMESQFCRENEIIVVGGGNSAGQAAVYLSHAATKVHIFVRSKTLAASMSNYLIERIQASPRIQIHFETEIVKLEGVASLDSVQWKNIVTGELTTRPIHNVFVMIGADPNTQWLTHCIDLDEKGFIKTGISRDGKTSNSAFETMEPGVFAVGDVRSDSIKRVASAVGEGSVVIQWVHRHLEQERMSKS